MRFLNNAGLSRQYKIFVRLEGLFVYVVAVLAGGSD